MPSLVFSCKTRFPESKSCALTLAEEFVIFDDQRTFLCPSSKNPRRILEGFISVSYPYPLGVGSKCFIVTYSDIAIGRIFGAEESQFESAHIGEYVVWVFNRLRRSNGVYGKDYV